MGVAIGPINLRSVQKFQVIEATSILDVPVRKGRVTSNQVPDAIWFDAPRGFTPWGD